MKVCRGVLFGTQVMDDGDVIQCCNLIDGVIGNAAQSNLDEIWNSKKAKFFFNKLAKGDYSVCDKRGCPYLASGKMENIPLVEVDEYPKYPTHLSISYERSCNYNCTCCGNAPNKHLDNEKLKDKIEQNLNPFLPHLKHISANGRGEVFASKHILRQLANWRPLAPKEEVTARIESNGSLFDEEHWKQIENLGQYDFRVDITVMSFNEHLYRLLSGVKFPVSRIVKNLKFIKSLREKGIVNHFQIATVVQDRNFREMPEFTRRCIEEFGADSVRLRPIISNVATLEGWLTDVRGKYHPYHQEYLKVMSDPIFKNPKVADWGAWNDSETGDLPHNQVINRLSNEMKVLSQMAINDAPLNALAKNLEISSRKVFIYSATSVGLTLAAKLNKTCDVQGVLDFNQQGEFAGIKVLSPMAVPPPSGLCLLYLLICIWISALSNIFVISAISATLSRLIKIYI